MKITLRQIKDVDLLANVADVAKKANKRIIVPFLQTGSLAGIELGQSMQTITFDTANGYVGPEDEEEGAGPEDEEEGADPEDEEEGVDPEDEEEGADPEAAEDIGFITLSDGTKLGWDGVCFALLDSDDAVIELFYDADRPEAERWIRENYNFSEAVSVLEINVADRSRGVWPLTTYKYRPPNEEEDFPEHAADEGNPHKVTAGQTGAYTKKEVDNRQSALINMSYKSGYWYGRRYTGTEWPRPGTDETWEAGSRKAFDFETNTVWIWDGTQWEAGEILSANNGTTVGISAEFLDIEDNGCPGKAVYSAEKESWDFYPVRDMPAGIPPGGAAGQILEKASGDDFDVEWKEKTKPEEVVSKTAPGLAPKLPAGTGTSKYLREDGAWAVPPDTVASSTPSSGSVTNASISSSAAIALSKLANVLLNDENASTTLPSTSSSSITSLLQTIRNNLKSLFAKDGDLAAGLAALSGGMKVKLGGGTCGKDELLFFFLDSGSTTVGASGQIYKGIRVQGGAAAVSISSATTISTSSAGEYGLTSGNKCCCLLWRMV
jgi:hypothetical protein